MKYPSYIMKDYKLCKMEMLLIVPKHAVEENGKYISEELLMLWWQNAWAAILGLALCSTRCWLKKKTRKTQLFSENPGGFFVFLPPGLATATLCSLSVGKSSNTDVKVKIPLIYIFLGELSSWQCWYLLFCPGRQFYFESDHQPQIWCPSSQMG